MPLTSTVILDKILAFDAKVFVEVGNADSGSGGDSLNVSNAEKFLDDLLRKHFTLIECRS